MNPEESRQPSPEVETETLVNDFEVKMELQNSLMEFDCELFKITDSEWVERYAQVFDEIYHDPELHIKERFKSSEVYDRDPRAFYAEISETLSSKYKERQSKI